MGSASGDYSRSPLDASWLRPLLIGRRIDEDPYRDLIEKLAKLVKVADVTDENTDVGFCLRLRRGRDSWHLMLSVVGRYAMLVRVARPWPGRFVKPVVEVVHDARSEIERAITDLIAEAGLTLLTQQQAEATVTFRNPSDEEPSLGPLYRVLFRDVADVEELSWRYYG